MRPAYNKMRARLCYFSKPDLRTVHGAMLFGSWSPKGQCEVSSAQSNVRFSPGRDPSRRDGLLEYSRVPAMDFSSRLRNLGYFEFASRPGEGSIVGLATKEDMPSEAKFVPT
jgi:hypothetical protein